MHTVPIDSLHTIRLYLVLVLQKAYFEHAGLVLLLILQSLLRADCIIEIEKMAVVRYIKTHTHMNGTKKIKAKNL